MSRGFSPAATAAFVTTLVVLGLVGWSIGWLAAGTELVAGQNPSAAPSSSPTRPSASATKSPTPTGPTPTFTIPADAFAMPDLVGMKFRDARREAFRLKLGVIIRFNEPGPDGRVMRTNPEEGQLVRPDFKITLYVAGPAPKVIMPLVLGMTCAKATEELESVGLVIQSYPSGQQGRVVKTDPPAMSQVTWNHQVNVYCALPSGS